MSPEQCAGDSRDLDIRSDVYSLGVVLYELLCGQLPYDLSHTPIPQATRVIQEIEPPRPSTISRTLRGDLEAIVLKALEKDRAKRFQSTADLVRNIRNHLAGKPIDIRPPSRFSLAIHWLVKHPIVTTSAACLTIAALSAASIWISVWWVGLRPYEIELSADGREARLVSMAGGTLHKWTTEAKGGITFAELVDRPPGLGGGQLALIGYSGAYENDYPGHLCAFEVTRPSGEPIWRDGITKDEIIEPFLSDGLSASGFSVQPESQAIDVFQQKPGKEIVAIYNHAPSSAAVVRVYSLDGDMLYQIWHDGAISATHWLSAPRRLVFIASNSEVYLSQRGYPGLQRHHPWVVFAARPTLGHIGQGIVTTTPGREMTRIAFYKCVLPIRDIDLIGELPLGKPVPGVDAARFVRLGLVLLNTPGAEVSWLIDESGVEVPNSRQVNDAWKLDAATPTADLFYLGDLPPIVSTTE